MKGRVKLFLSPASAALDLSAAEMENGVEMQELSSDMVPPSSFTTLSNGETQSATATTPMTTALSGAVLNIPKGHTKYSWVATYSGTAPMGHTKYSWGS